MFFNPTNSKEAIKTRMFRIALAFWQIKNIDELDPLVKILMEALSAQLYDVMGDIKNTESRILERIAHLLTPDLLTAPAPAHAIMQARPAEVYEVIDSNNRFCIEERIASKQDGVIDTTIDICFSAVNKAKIFDAEIAYSFSGSGLYFFGESGNRTSIGQIAKSISANESIIWLGLKTNSQITTINGLSFFFDFNTADVSSAEQLYRYLPLCKWYVNGRQINVSPGLNATENGNGYQENDLSDTDLIHSLQSTINNYYEKKFVTITDNGFEIKPETLKRYPDPFEIAFSQSTLQKIEEELVWIKIVFPTSIQQQVLDGLQVKLNAFPVFNCKKTDLKYRLRGGRSIIPLPNLPNERFIAIKSITDGVKEYKAIPFKKSEDEAPGTYTLRTGGMERFDSRNGKEMIQYLLELLRSDSAAFSSVGHDYVANTLKEMNQLIALMEQKTNTALSDAVDIPNYVVVKPEENQEIMFVEYWTTNALISNNIRSGTKLHQSGGTACKPDSLVLLTTTIGGKDKMKSEEKLYAFKHSLLTRNRIVTVEDIRSFCYFELGGRLDNVKVKRGFVISDNLKEGALRTIDVILTPANQKSGDQEEWKQLCDQLKSKLQTRSGMSYNYRILVREMA